jgi:Zn/Cd-binding protein ZinT
MTSDNISEYDEYKNNLLTDSLNLFLNAKDVKFQKEKENINISYTLDGSEETITYDTIRGVLNGR